MCLALIATVLWRTNSYRALRTFGFNFLKSHDRSVLRTGSEVKAFPKSASNHLSHMRTEYLEEM